MIQQLRRRRQSGQGMLEYALLLALMVGVFKMMDGQIRKHIAGIWTKMAQNIAPGCPGCTPPDEIK